MPSRSGRREFENGSTEISVADPATALGCTVNISGRVENYARHRTVAVVSALEVIQHSQFPCAGCSRAKLENRAAAPVAVCTAAALGRAVKISCRIEGQGSDRKASVNAAC